MGRKQKKFWQYILLFPASCLIVLIAITGCQVSVEHPGVSQQHEPDQLPKTRSGRDIVTNPGTQEARLLDQADESIKNGEIVKALQSVSEAISCCSKGHISDRTLATLQNIQAHPDYKLRNHDHAVSCLRKLEATFPRYGYDPTTGCRQIGLSEMPTQETEIQNLKETTRSQEKIIRTLKKQLAQLKAVDLELVQPEPAVEAP
jgi:hypothetical protein